MNTVLEKLKHIFIPHKQNDYKPHFFREASILSITVFAIVLLLVSASSRMYIKSTNMTAAVLPAVLVDLTNNARTSSNEYPLVRNSILDHAAELKAEDMARNGYFAHTSPAGITPWYWFDKAGYVFAYAGENLAIDFTESADVENAWLNSPTHKANILNDHFSEIGIATFDGVYQGNQTTYVVQMFGTPARMNKTEIPVSSAPNVKEPSPMPPKPKSTPITTALALTPVVKGESVSNTNNLETIVDTKEFAVVKNTSVEETTSLPPDHSYAMQYSTWYEKLIFRIPDYTDRMYQVVIWITLIALIIMMVIEARHHHPKNIMYGVLVLMLVCCLIYINKSFFMMNIFM